MLVKKRKWGFVFSVFALSLATLVGCGGEEGAQKVETSEGAQEQKEEAKPEIFKVGDVVKLGDLQLTLKSAKYVDDAEYTPAEKGKVLAIEFETVNNGKEQLYFGAEEFAISTQDGTQHEEYFGHDDGFMNENIGAGKKITGKIYFDVPEDSKYELVYTPSFSWDNENITFEITPQ